MALYQRGAIIDDTTIVLVREFRSSASTPDGLMHGYLAAQEPQQPMHLIKLSAKPRKKRGSPSTFNAFGSTAIGS